MGLFMTTNHAPPRRRARSREAKEQKRRSLLEAALALFTTHGYQGTSIELITERAGESTGTFYLYFTNKVDIYRSLTVEGFEILNAMLREAVSWPGMNAPARISAAIHAYFWFFREHRGYYDIINVLHIGQQDFVRDPGNVDRINRMASELLEFLSSIIREGMDAGELVAVNAWEATCAVWGMLDGMFILEIRNNMGHPGRVPGRAGQAGAEHAAPRPGPNGVSRGPAGSAAMDKKSGVPSGIPLFVPIRNQAVRRPFSGAGRSGRSGRSPASTPRRAGA